MGGLLSFPYLRLLVPLGGMTVAFNDVVFLTKVLAPFLEDQTATIVAPDGHEQLSSRHPARISVDWEDLQGAIREWHWTRKGLTSTVNILSIALYDLFSADGKKLSWLFDQVTLWSVELILMRFHRCRSAYLKRRLLCVF